MVNIDELYKKWKERISETRINLTYPSLKGLWQWFLRETERRRIDPETIDFVALVDPTLTYDENKQILLEDMKAPLTEESYEKMYVEYKNELLDEASKKYPEVIEPLMEKMADLEREKDKAKRYKKLVKELRWELEESKKLIEQERKARAEKVKPAKLKVLRDFTEGILTYKAGSEVESADLEWVMAKIAEGKLGRVGEAPLPTPLPTAMPTLLPTPKPEWKEEVLPVQPAYLTADQVNRLWEEFGSYARFKYPDSSLATEPKTYRIRFLERIKDAKNYDEAAKRIVSLVDAIIRETRPAAPMVERRIVPMEERERMVYELGTNQWWHERLERERSKEYPTLEQFLLSKYKKRSLGELPQTEWEKILREYDDFLLRK